MHGSTPSCRHGRSSNGPGPPAKSCALFCVRKVVTLVDFTSISKNINDAAVCTTMKKLRPSIQNRMFNGSIILLRHNAKATWPVTQDFIKYFCWGDQSFRNLVARPPLATKILLLANESLEIE